jgi:hypothetical protein
MAGRKKVQYVDPGNLFLSMGGEHISLYRPVVYFMTLSTTYIIALNMISE